MRKVKNKYLIIIPLFLSALFVATIATASPAHALTENQENQLADLVDNLGGDLDNLVDRVDSIENDISGIDGDIDGMQSEINDLQGLKDNLSDLSHEISVANDRITNIEGSFSSDISDLETEISESMTQISQMENTTDERIDTIEAELTAQVENTLSKYTDNMGTMSGRITTLSDELAILQNDVDKEKREPGWFLIGGGAVVGSVLLVVVFVLFGLHWNKLDLWPTSKKDYNINDIVNEEKDKLDWMIENKDQMGNLEYARAKIRAQEKMVETLEEHPDYVEEETHGSN